jgi:hypothetical protein
MSESLRNYARQRVSTLAAGKTLGSSPATSGCPFTPSATKRETTNMAYNGWTNYETWCVNLWLENEPGTYEDKRDIIRRESDQRDASKALQSYVEDMMPDLGASLWSDMLTAAFSEVDWDEIVENAWSEEHDDEEED